VRVLGIAIAVGSGLTVLLGFFLPALASAQTLLLKWGMILSGVAVLVGTFHLLAVHFQKVLRWQPRSAYSFVLALALIGTFLLGLALGPGHAAMGVVLNAIILPAEAAFMGLLAVTLLYAAVRLLRRRLDLSRLVFLLAAGLALLGTATLPFGEVPLVGSILRPWLTDVLALGGARGILIGVALGTLTAGLRLLLGADRPYGDS
jgi:hypothetical protein